MKRKKQSLNKIIDIAFILAGILWTGFIFYNSLQTATESLEQSGVFVEIFIKITKTIYGDVTPTRMMRYIEVNLVDDIRNAAHIFEFFVLYILVSRALQSFKRILNFPAYAFLYGFIIIMADETIQIFVDGRGFQLKDIIFDSLGMVLAYFMILLTIYIGVRRSINNSST